MAALMGAISVLGTACGASGQAPGAAPQPLPVQSAGPSGSPGSGVATSPSATVAAFFEFEGFTFRPVSADVIAEFKGAAKGSLGDAGSVGGIQAAEARRGNESAVTVIAFTLVPNAGSRSSEQDLLKRVMDGMGSGLGGDWKPGLSGQGFTLKTSSATAAIAPWATLPDGSTVFLLATGDHAAPVEEVARGLITA
jgi:hypothetical protein